MPIMTDKRDEANGPAPLDSDSAQAAPSGSAKGQDQIIHDDVHVWESLGNGDGYRYRVPGGWLYTLNCAKDEDGPDRPVFVPEPRQ